MPSYKDPRSGLGARLNWITAAAALGMKFKSLPDSTVHAVQHGRGLEWPMSFQEILSAFAPDALMAETF